MALEIGRLGQVYLKKEAAYGVEEVLASANALRHVNVQFAFDPFQRVTSPEKRQSPGPVNRFNRKKSASLGTLATLLRPSGVLNTLPECSPLIEAGFGAVTNVTLSTTVDPAPAPTTTGATVASAGTLAIGDGILISVTGQAASPFVRFLTNVAGNALTWAPALPAAPTSGDAVKGGITYKMTTALAISLTIAHYLPVFKRELLGAAVDSLVMNFDANEEVQLSVSGPAADQLTGTAQAKPVAFTTVGGNPPSGLVGNLLIDNTAYLVKTLELNVTNGLMVRNQEYGVNAPTEVLRNGQREVSVSLEAFSETEATVYDKAEAGTNVSVLNQTGRTEGNILGLYLPRVEFKVPETDDPDEEVNWSFSGMALATADGLNDECRFAIL